MPPDPCLRLGPPWALSALILVLLVLVGCGPAPNGTNALPPPLVSVSPAQQIDAPVQFEYPARAAGSREVDIIARVTGHIERRHFTEGSRVRAGERLFTLDTRPFAAAVASAEAALARARAEVAQAQAQANQAEREATRLAPLAADRVIGQKAADDAQSTAETARAGLLAAQARALQAEAQLRQARLELDYAVITAPVDGLVGAAEKVEGALVGPQDRERLASLVQVDPLYIRYSVGDAERSAIAADVQSGRLRLPPDGLQGEVLLADGSRVAAQGRVTFSSPSADPQTGAFEYRISLPNADQRIRPGQFVRVRLTGATIPRAVVVPQRAVLEGPSGKQVLLLDRGEDKVPRARAQPVEVGEWVDLGDGQQGRLWVIRSGLKVGDPVITDGVMRLKPGMEVQLGAEPSAPPAP